jgi:hypothetical protein
VARDPFQSGRRLSFVAAVALAVAAFVTLSSLQLGATGFEERLKLLLDQQGAWVTGWSLRMVSAGLLLAFFVALSRALTPGHPILRSVAVPLATVAAAGEIFSGTLAATVLPALAGRVAEEPEVLPSAQVVEAVAASLSGVVAAGLFAIAGALLTHAAFRTPPFPRALALASLPVWGVGVAAAGATLAGSRGGGDLIAYLFLPLLAIWTFGVGVTFFRPPANG